MKIPTWASTPEHRVRFLVRRAAVYHNARGRLDALSAALGLSDGALTTVVTRGRISRATAQKIADCVGADVFPVDLITFQ